MALPISTARTARARAACALAAALALLAPAAAAASRVKELVDVVGVRDNVLVGYGLVVGLAGTGDSERLLFTQQSLAGMLGRLGIRIDPRDVRARNVAAVMVTARLPPFARPGTRVDVAVGSLGNARSIAGGILLSTPLAAGDGRVYAVAEGPVQVGGFEAGSGATYVRHNTPTSGRIAGAAIVERSVEAKLPAGPVLLALRRPDLTTASRIAAAANAKLGAGVARALDAAGVEVTPPDARKEDLVAFLSEVEALEVEADGRARVVVSERTGTLVAGEGVRIRPVAIAHGGLQVNVRTTSLVSQPSPFSRQGSTVTTRDQDVRAEQAPGAAVALPATATVQDLAKALNTIGAAPRDLIAILEAMKAAGALEAELEVLE